MKLYHGSPKKLKILKPKTPKGGENGATSMKGLYATDLYDVAHFIALLDRSKLPINKQKIIFTWKVNNNKITFFITPNIRKILPNLTGYVYELISDSFIKTLINNEYYSESKQVPYQVHKVYGKSFSQVHNIKTISKEFVESTKDFSKEEMQEMGY